MVSWSEVSHIGARSAIQCKAQCSMEAVSAWFTRRAGSKIICSLLVVVFAFIILSFPSSASIKLFLNCIAGRAQCELQRFAWNAFHIGAKRPAEAGWNGSTERDRLDLQVKSAVALLVTPVGIQPPEEPVFFAGIQRTLLVRTGRADFAGPCPSRRPVSMLCIKASTGYGIGLC